MRDRNDLVNVYIDYRTYITIKQLPIPGKWSDKVNFALQDYAANYKGGTGSWRGNIAVKELNKRYGFVDDDGVIDQPPRPKTAVRDIPKCVELIRSRTYDSKIAEALIRWVHEVNQGEEMPHSMVSLYLDDDIAREKDSINKRMKRYNHAVDIAWHRLNERFEPRQVQNLIQSLANRPGLSASELETYTVSDGGKGVELSYMERCVLADRAAMGVK